MRLNQSKRNLLDIVVKTDIFPLSQKFQCFNLDQNRFNKRNLLRLKGGLLIRTLTLGRNRCKTFRRRKDLIFLQLLNRYSFLRINPEYLAEYLRQKIKYLLPVVRIVPQLHLLDVEPLGTLGIDLKFHVNTFEWKIAE